MTILHPLELCEEEAVEDDFHQDEMEAVEALAALAGCSAKKSHIFGFDSLPKELGKESTTNPSPNLPNEKLMPRLKTNVILKNIYQNIYQHSKALWSYGKETGFIGGNISPMVPRATNIEETVKIAPKSKRVYQCIRKKLTEAEKQAQKHRRILANRESARETIRRRQAEYMELMKKAAELSEKNENLKKEKELAVKQYNSLKHKNEILGREMANVKNTEPRMTSHEDPKSSQEPPKSSQEEIPTPGTVTPVFLYNQPSMVSFWPACSSLQHGDTGSEMMGITRPGNPVFVLPVPCFVPFPGGYNGMLHYYSQGCNVTPAPTHQRTLYEQSYNLAALGAGFAYPRATVEKLSCDSHVGSTRITSNELSNNVNANSAAKPMPQSSTKIRRHKRRAILNEATTARMKRMELMRLKTDEEDGTDEAKDRAPRAAQSRRGVMK